MHLTLRRRIVLTLAPLVLLPLALGGAGTGLILNLGNRAGAILQENYRSIEAMDRLTDALRRLDHALLMSLKARDGDPGRAAFDGLWPVVREQFSIEADNITLPGEAELVAQLRRRLDDYEGRCRELLALPAGSAERAKAYGGREGMEPALADVVAVCEDVRRLNEDTMHAADRAARRTARSSVVGFAVGLGAAILLAAFFAWWLARGILRPIEEVTRAARLIGAGDLQLSVPVFGNDELGQLAEAFNTMTRYLREYRQSNTAQLLRARQTGQATIDSFTDPVVVVDPAGRVELANPAARHVFGVAPAEGGAPASVWIPPEALRRPVAEALQLQRPYLTESFDQAVTFQLEGGERSFLPRVWPIRDPQGGATGAAVILDDVTRFRLLDRFKSDLVATVSHELKTPLTGIRLAVHVLLEETVGPLEPKQLELLVDARENTERFLRMIESLLSLARLEHGEGYRMRAEAPASLLRAAADAAAGRAEDKHVRLVVEAEEGLPPVEVDAERFGHALNNLVDNALTYTEPGGRVTLSAKPAGGKVRLSVADTGPGIPPESLPHVFTRFFRVPGRERGPGTGLGLAIVREVVLAHKGEIVCESEPGRGAAFHIDLPAGKEGP